MKELGKGEEKVGGVRIGGMVPHRHGLEARTEGGRSRRIRTPAAPLNALVAIFCLSALGCAREAPVPLSNDDLAGFWSGSYEVWGDRVELVVHLALSEAEVLEARLHLPEQGVVAIPSSAVVVDDGRVTFDFSSIGGSYQGRMTADSTRLKGDWLQSGAKFRLDLLKTEDYAGPPRPQEPVPPLPYQVDSVSFPNSKAGLVLAGTLTVPPGPGIHPAAVLVSGSGPQDRDETLFAHRPFLVLADHLTRAGIAVLRYDDRGVGASTGEFGTATTEDFASDAAAALAYLAGRPEVDSKRIGIVGHSEGGIVGPIAARDNDQVAFLVLLAPSGMPGRDLIPLQTELILRASGVPEPLLRLNQRVQADLLDLALAGDGPDEKATRLRGEFDRFAGGLPSAAVTALGLSAEFNRAIDELLKELGSPWLAFFLTFDPVPVLESVSVPVLALFGSKDLQVPPDPNLGFVKEALEQGESPDVTVVELDGLNHLFQRAATGSPSEYGGIGETFAPGALEAVSRWIVSRMNVAGRNGSEPGVPAALGEAPRDLERGAVEGEESKQ